MSDAQFRLEDDDVAEDVRVKTYGASDDHLATTRLPSIAGTIGGTSGGRPPLPPARVPSVPPPAGVPASPAAAFVPPSPPAFAPLNAAPPPPAASPAPPVEVPHVPVPRQSWWRSLLASTRPPADSSSEVTPLDDRAARQQVGAACAAMGLVVMLLALVIGLREAPQSILMSPTVAATVVLARAAVSVAMFYVGVTCLRAAERLYFR